MPKIVFRGKTYYSVYEMPPNVRSAYKKEQKKLGANAGETKEKTESTDHLPSPMLDSGAGSAMPGLMWGILVALVLSGIAYLLSRLIP